ncbi:hypothetical protein K438DRAFT_1771217 [Mycena galopus ATCC 62051]|nr:hypothetical protein K438DRAFT_1771217 [Mycena galopus ATCC 62051]
MSDDVIVALGFGGTTENLCSFQLLDVRVLNFKMQTKTRHQIRPSQPVMAQWPTGPLHDRTLSALIQGPVDWPVVAEPDAQNTAADAEEDEIPGDGAVEIDSEDEYIG